MASRNSNMDSASFKTPQGSDMPDDCIRQKFKENTLLSNNGAYYQPWRNSSIELPQVPAKDKSGSESRDDYRMRYRNSCEVMRMNSVSSSCLLQPFGVNFRRDLEPSFRKYNDVRRKSSKGETVENESSNLTMKGSEYHNSFNLVHPRQIAKVYNNFHLLVSKFCSL